MAEIFIEQSRLNTIADAIAAIEPCPFTGVVTRDQIVAALGEAGDIWPVTIMDDAIRAAVMDQEKYSRRDLQFPK